MKKKELRERLTELAKARGFVCEAPSGKVKDLQLTFNQKELVELIDQEVDKAREEGYEKGKDYQARLDRELYGMSFEQIKSGDFKLTTK